MSLTEPFIVYRYLADGDLDEWTSTTATLCGKPVQLPYPVPGIEEHEWLTLMDVLSARLIHVDPVKRLNPFEKAVLRCMVRQISEALDPPSDILPVE